MHIITVHNPVEASCGAILAGLIKPCISWESAYYRQGIYRKERKVHIKSMLSKGKGGIYYFWAGLLQHILDYCTEKGINVTVIDKSKEEFLIYEAELPGITFREDQLRLINTFLDDNRGILVSFTGSGKTVLGFGCISSFVDMKVLWLCHKKDLMLQAYDEGKRFGFKSIGRVGDGYAEYGKDITIATRQSFKKLADEYGHIYDMVIVDEVHHVAELDSEYAYVLARVPAPLRLGLTATLPKEGEPYLTAVGLIGPVLQELTINEGNELGILAKPKIKILRMKKDYNIASMRKYTEVYNAAIVNRLERNVLIAVTAKQHVKAGDTVLIMINMIEHGVKILEQLKALGVKAEFVRGSTKGDNRTDIKHALNSGELQCVICSSVWTEGVNIPNLNVVIAAAGGKSEIGTLQRIGRGLRKTKDKDEVWIYDFFDQTHHYLIDHFGERLMVYLEAEWL